MKEKKDIVSMYSAADVDGRIKLMLKNYSQFTSLVDSQESNICVIIKYECECSCHQDRDALGVRVQKSGTSDPTFKAALTSVVIEEAVRKGDLTEIAERMDREELEIHENEIQTIRHMREDYLILENAFLYLKESEAEILKKYLASECDAKYMAREHDTTYDAARCRIRRIQNILIDYVESVLTRKYRYA